ncbi:MAG: hybrid sensor histidine kinase/response regulator [Tenuifilaceae bacterium]|jgi:signal transduction histidine kinase|nr:hybrid sensor histidine kinase/response regulator [Tenuifilaceae bacterium]
MKKNGTILIVDDSKALLSLITEYLYAEGYSTHSVESGEDALSFLTNHHPDLILLDRTLPGLDGFEVCRQINSNRKLAKIPIIFLTATSDLSIKVEGFKLGAVDYITKPFQKEELLARVNSHIELYKLSRLLKEQAENLRESEKNLKELNATKDKFFSIIAHDLRSPMNNLLELARLLKMKYDIGDLELISEIVTHLFNTAENTNELLLTLLDWASVQRGVMPYNPEPIQLKKMVDNCFEPLAGNARGKGISFVNLTSEDTMVLADQNMLSTIIRNLISNAIKFTEQGGLISVSSEFVKDFINICISDTGVGMDPKTVKNLFFINKVRSSPGTQGELGTGLGLTLCKDFIELHNGKVWVESELGKGTRIWFSLPYSS